ncbi:hypothetical protein ACP4OV_010762 [Aristida adscensionis]
MRSPSSSLVFLLTVVLPLVLHLAVLHAASVDGGAHHQYPEAGRSSPAAVAAEEDRRGEHQHGHGGGAGVSGEQGEEELYRKVARFAVWVYCLHHGIRPEPALERVESATTRRAERGGVEYLLVLRVAPPLGTCRALVWGVPGEGSRDWKLKYFQPAAGP